MANSQRSSFSLFRSFHIDNGKRNLQYIILCIVKALIPRDYVPHFPLYACFDGME